MTHAATGRLFTLTLTEWEARRVMEALHAEVADTARHMAATQERYGTLGPFQTRDEMALIIEAARSAEVCRRLADELDLAEREREE